MDKTGTITKGRPRITSVTPIGVDEKRLLAIAAGLEQQSEHPLAAAVVQKAKEQSVLPLAMTSFAATFGKGVTAQTDGHVYAAGNAAFLEELGADVTNLKGHLDALADDGATPLIFAEDGHIIGILGAADEPKATSRAAIEKFQQIGIDVVMLTGPRHRRCPARRQG